MQPPPTHTHTTTTTHTHTLTHTTTHTPCRREPVQLAKAPSSTRARPAEPLSLRMCAQFRILETDSGWKATTDGCVAIDMRYAAYIRSRKSQQHGARENNPLQKDF